MGLQEEKLSEEVAKKFSLEQTDQIYARFRPPLPQSSSLSTQFFLKTLIGSFSHPFSRMQEAESKEDEKWMNQAKQVGP